MLIPYRVYCECGELIETAQKLRPDTKLPIAIVFFAANVMLLLWVNLEAKAEKGHKVEKAAKLFRSACTVFLAVWTIYMLLPFAGDLLAYLIRSDI